MARQARLVLSLATLAFSVALAGCSGDEPAPTPSSAGSTASTTAPAPPTVAPSLSQADAVAELQSYLNAWSTDGPASASQAYLTADQQVSNDADAPKLASGKVTQVTGARPGPGGELTLQVTLDLTFDGDPIAWTNGVNDRFVTFTPRGGQVPYAMSFATGP